MAQEKGKHDHARKSDRRVLRVDRRINDKDIRQEELGLPLPLPDRRKVYSGERRGDERRSEVIPIRQVHSCIYVEGYEFHECAVKSCKNFTDVTASKCLAVDRVQPAGNKIISDAELHLYKYSADKVSTRLISIKRKKAITRVKAILILHSLLEYIRDNHKPKERVYNTKLIEKLESEYPLKIAKLQFYNWMWPYLTSKKVWKKFSKLKGGECSDFKIHMLLNLTKSKYDTLISQLKDNTNELATETEGSDDWRTGKLEKLVGLGAQQLKSKRHHQHDHERRSRK
jgi:L-fucose mutarotase/ribose pyranase (RbsD/FucU family)